MKRVVYSTLLFLVIAIFSSVRAQNAKIGVISDLHYTHPSLIVEKGKALDDYLHRDRKLLLESDALLRKSVENLLKENVDIVLIPGDLTKDGETISHKGVVELLSPLREKGVKILVVPGNHDINNPKAVSFHGNETHSVPSVTSAQFREIYNDYGFGNAISLDEHSLSYVNEPIEGLRVICIDACKYDENTFVSRGEKKDSCVTHGAIKPETMRWIKTEIQLAKLLGKQVVAMMHHGVVEHFNHQSFFAGPYLVDDFEQVQESFLEAGLNIVFTGHFHASDIAKTQDEKGNFLYDVETGSIVTYPCPYRIINMVDNQLDIQTKKIDEINYPLPLGTTFQQHAQNMLNTGFNEMVTSLIKEYHSTLPTYLPKWLRPFIKIPNEDKFAEIVLANLSPSAVNMLAAHYGGNENQVINYQRHKDELIASLDGFVSDLCYESAGRFGGMAKNIVLRSSTLKKTKMAVSSIWENAILANEEKLMMKPINDLNYVLTIHETNNNIDNDYFYTIDDGKNEMKVQLSNSNSENKEKPQIVHKNNFAVLGRKTTIVSE